MTDDIAASVSRRRTFAIISHPDAGKTTLTEKLLLFGGAIQLAGEVRAKANRRQTRSDWMGIERERGISVVTSVMTFEYGDCVFNLLDTPGHEDFSEDTYRTLTAVDSAVMVIDAAKGIEARTRKLFEVCRLRDIPIVTFINKMDRETRDPVRPPRRDREDAGARHRAADLADRARPIASPAPTTSARRRADAARQGRDAIAGQRARTIRASPSFCPSTSARAAIEELNARVERPAAVRQEGLPRRPSDAGAVRQRAARISACATSSTRWPNSRRRRAPRPPTAAPSTADEPKMTGFVFKIQANMDPNHRDRIAFMRVCSGKLARGMRAKLVRTGKPITLSAPQFFFAQDRSLAEEAFAGDVVGIPNHGLLRIGDTLERRRGDRLSRRAELRARKSCAASSSPTR